MILAYGSTFVEVEVSSQFFLTFLPIQLVKRCYNTPP